MTHQALKQKQPVNRFTGTKILTNEEARLQRQREEEDGSNIVDAALLALAAEGAIEIVHDYDE